MDDKKEFKTVFCFSAEGQCSLVPLRSQIPKDKPNIAVDSGEIREWELRGRMQSKNAFMSF